MPTHPYYPDCGAIWKNDTTCQDHFHQMLFWEAKNPSNNELNTGEVAVIVLKIAPRREVYR